MKRLSLILAGAVLTVVFITVACDEVDKLTNSVGAQVIVGVMVSDGTNVKTFAEESGGQELTVTIAGDDKDYVKGEMEESISLGTYVVDTNIKKPSADDPMKFTLIFKASGYLTTAKTYYITGNSTKTDYVILTNLTADNAGVDVGVVKKGSASNGVVSEEVQAATDGGKAAITIPQGVTLKTEDGTLLSGDLISTIAHFDAGDPRALGAFPGGIDAVAEDSEGDTGPVNFTSAGFVSVEVTDENGNSAAKIEGGSIGVEIAASNTTYNQDTGNTIEDGDEIPLWSFDESKGEWVFEKTTTITSMYTPGTRSGEKVLGVKTELSHLSSYNLDFKGDACDVSTRINIDNRTGGDDTVILEMAGDESDKRGKGFNRKIFINSGDSYIEFNNAPKDLKVRLSQFSALDSGSMSTVEQLIMLIRILVFEEYPSSITSGDPLEIENLCDRSKQHTLVLTK